MFPAKPGQTQGLKRRTLLRCVGAALACLSREAEAAPPPPEFRIIVHRQNLVGSLSRAFVAEAFLKKVTRWDGGSTIRPVDQRPKSQVRRRFTETVLKRPVNAVRNYWQQRIFSGRDVPPPELDSDEAVVSYVGRHEGAIGYVSGTAALGGVREVSLH